MDVLVGSSSSATATSSLFLNQNDAVRGGLNGAGSSDSFSSSSSSSIGAPDDSADNEDDKADVTDSEEAQSEFNTRGLMTSLGSMNSLEDSLPIKYRRGLSNYFSGKSKSFASLSDVVTTASTVKEIEKKDNPFNKRRRVLIASKWHRKSSSSSFYNNANLKSMPSLLASLDEDKEEEETQEDLSSSDEKEPSMIRTPRLVDRGLKKSGFKSMSCYCLSDLQGHDDHDGH